MNTRRTRRCGPLASIRTQICALSPKLSSVKLGSISALKKPSISGWIHPKVKIVRIIWLEPMSTDITKRDPDLVRWVAHLLVQGNNITQIKQKLRENSLMDSALAPSDVDSLIRLAQLEADSLKELVLHKAEMADSDWLRLDSYARRKRAVEKLEELVDEAHDMSDTVGHLAQVAFMQQAVIKSQDSMDDFTGAKANKPIVQVNLNYDPLDQMRTIIQEEVHKEMNTIDIDADVVDEEE